MLEHGAIDILRVLTRMKVSKRVCADVKRQKGASKFHKYGFPQ